MTAPPNAPADAWPPRIALGCMRLPDDVAPDVIREAARAGAALDTARAYGDNPGHNERIVAAAQPGLVMSKAGMRRKGQRWIPDGRARAIEKDVRASKEVLGNALQLVVLHAPDPEVDLLTSWRALARLRQSGVVPRIGLSNVRRDQLLAAHELAPVDAIQVAVNPFDHEALWGGVTSAAIAHGIVIFAHSPLGGPSRISRVRKQAALNAIAQRKSVTPEQIALAWIRSLGPIVPVVGARSLAHWSDAVTDVALTDEDRQSLWQAFPASRWAKGTPPRPRAPHREVVLIAGPAGAGKSTRVKRLLDPDTLRLNRDERGGTLKQMATELSRSLQNNARVLLDNTFLTRAQRAPFIDAAFQAGARIRCDWLAIDQDDALTNAARRLLTRYGELPDAAALKTLSKKDPQAFLPTVVFRHVRESELPDKDEGFDDVELIAFERVPDDRPNRAIIVAVDALLANERLAAPLRRAADGGWIVAFTAWQPEGDIRKTVLEATGLSNVELDVCPHPAGPPTCWCRKPLPGLGLLLAERADVALSRSIVVGDGASDAIFARRIGSAFIDLREDDAIFQLEARIAT